MQEKTTARRIRWARNGALILAGLAILLGSLFNILIMVAQQAIPADADALFWLGVILRTALIWGVGGLFFGSLLGMYASMIWRDDSV